ncbi:hypothetical protein BGZ58_004330 [Dissophora ornata]|nr:hypothetical protein BGZ58_004330 [Dissophora ornata]
MAVGIELEDDGDNDDKTAAAAVAVVEVDDVGDVERYAVKDGDVVEDAVANVAVTSAVAGAAEEDAAVTGVLGAGAVVADVATAVVVAPQAPLESGGDSVGATGAARHPYARSNTIPNDSK